MLVEGGQQKNCTILERRREVQDHCDVEREGQQWCSVCEIAASLRGAYQRRKRIVKGLG